MTLSKSFFMLTAAFFAIATLVIAVAVALSVPTASAVANSVVLVAGIIAASLLYVEAKRDLDAVLTLLCAMCGITAMSTAIYLFYADRTGFAPKVAVAVAAIGAVAAGYATYRRQKSESPDFPNVVARLVNFKSVFETEGIQFMGRLLPGGRGKPHTLSILLQNCFDAPRDVTITLDPAGAEKYLRLLRRHTVQMGPAEVSRTDLPIVSPTYPGSYPLYISIAVAKAQGKRVRLWRAQEATNRVKPAATVAMLAMGHLHVGGGIRVTVGPLPDDLWNADLAPVKTESLWRPRIGTVSVVQSLS